MIRDLILAGRELAGYTDVRLRRGLAWSVAEGVFAAAPFGCVYLLLRDTLRGELTGTRTAMIAAALLLCMAARVGCSMRAMPAIFTGAYAMMAQARLRIAEHLRKLPIGWMERQRSGSLAATLAVDLQQVEDIWAHFLGIFFGGLLVPILLTALLAWLDWRLCLVVLATLPCAFALLQGGQHVLTVQARKLQAANARGQAEVLEYVQGIAVIRAFENGAAQGRTLARLTRTLAEMHRRAVAIEVWPAPLIALFGFGVEAGFAVAMWFGAQRLGGGMSGETLLLFAVVALPVYRQLFDVGLSLLLLRHTRRALQRIRALLNERTLPEPAGPIVPQGWGIEIDDLHFDYDRDTESGAGTAGQAPAAGPVLSGIRARMAPGTLTAIVGPSGSGKTTLLHLIARLWDVRGGSVRVGGVDVRDIGTQTLHRHVSMVFQDVVMFSGSVLENLRMGRPDASREEVIAAARAAQAHEFIEQLAQGYDTPLGENGAQLSGGQRQRLSIARALLKDAPILLLDEATASVDASASAQIQRALATLVRGRTVVVVAHRLRSIQGADQILVLQHGRLVEQGRHDELMAAGGTYAALWAFQERTSAWRLRTQAPH